MKVLFFLMIRADKEVEFRHAQRLIKLATKAGIDQLAYASLNGSVEGLKDKE
ncbi:MAG: biopolymer transport protein ExbD [Akkermansiaceae bacterium]|jgi:biopolymer transport protein ExbD